MRCLPKTFVAMIAAQAACLALGLWLETRFLSYPDDPAAAPVAAAARAESPLPAGEATSDVESDFALRGLTFVWTMALQAIVAYLVLARMRADSSRQQLQSTRESIERQQDLVRTRDAVIFGLAKLAESRDPETGYHLERIAYYSTRLANALRRRPAFRQQITPGFIKLIGISSALHDIGKVGVQDSILLKPGRLAESERLIMQMHSAIGGKCIREIELRLGKSNFLQMARDIALYHHERWDGSGYPRGLAGEQIPLAARIVAVADVYDALSSKRVYKDAFPHDRCVAMIREGAGTQFDPAVVEALLEVEADFCEIARRWFDADQPIAACRGETQPLGTLNTLDPAGPPAASDEEPVPVVFAPLPPPEHYCPAGTA